PGTPLWKQLAPRVYETDWQKFDGFTPTFEHPNLSARELKFLLGAAYNRFYLRPSWLADWTRVTTPVVRAAARRMDVRAAARHTRLEQIAMQGAGTGGSRSAGTVHASSPRPGGWWRSAARAASSSRVPTSTGSSGCSPRRSA